MTLSTEAAIRALADSNNDIILSSLTAIAQALESLYYQASTWQLDPESIRAELRRIVEILEQIKATPGSRDRASLFAAQYPAFAQHVRSRYYPCLPADTLQAIAASEQRAAGLEKVMLAQGYMLLAFEGEELGDRAEKLSAGMLVLSEVLGDYQGLLPASLFAAARNAAQAILQEPTVQQPYAQPETVANYLIALKNVARAVLWQLDRVAARQSFPARELAAWLAIAPAWKDAPSLPQT